MRNGIRIVKMKVVTDDDSGMVGFVPEEFEGWSNYRPSAGLGFGHDVIEHLGKQTGAFDEELAAHGGILFTTNFLLSQPSSPIYTPAQSLASGMPYQFKESTVDHIREAPKRAPISWNEYREIREFAAEYVRAMRKEWDDENKYQHQMCEPGNCECDPNPFKGREARKRILGWLAYGYARAKREYKDNRWQALALKHEIDTVTGRAIQHYSEYADSGAIFTMRLDLEECEVKITEPRNLYGEW
jgi:hypothetical protein